MNKQQLIEKAVIELSGKWSFHHDYMVTPSPENIIYAPYSRFEKISDPRAASNCWVFVCSKEEFNDAAKRMGYINGYRYGVEYPTNGKKPDLPDDVFVQIKHDGVKDWLSHERVDFWSWTNPLKGEVFRISDLRYKPAEPAPAKHWFEAGELPAIGCFVDVVGFVVYGIGEKDCEVVAHVENCAVIRMSYGLGCFQAECLKPSMTDKEKAIEAAVKVCTGVNIATTTDGLTMKTLNKLYDAGLLRLPDNKKPD